MVVQTEYLTLSDIDIIGECKVSPYAAEIDERTEAMCLELGIKPKHFREYTTMTPYLFPYGDVDRLVAISVLNNFLFFIDDFINDDLMKEHDVENRKLFGECIQILYGKRPAKPAHQLHLVTYDIAQLFRATAHPEWMTRFTHSVASYLKYTTLPIESIKTNGYWNVDKYISHREQVSGMYPTVDLIEYASRICLPQSAVDHPFLQSMRRLTAQYCCLLNDLFSYHKEVVEGGSQFNLLHILQESWNLSFDEALHEGVRRLNYIAADYRQLADYATRWQNDTSRYLIEIYVNGMSDQFVAAWHWQMSTNRYRSPDSPIPELRDLIKTEAIQP